ncbi:hypothetical protein [Pseudomonas sp. TWI929]|uniref:hypothetical protein n=1 Tax=Pseudomonas sp. TWI929 TaxID=3136795 RepID=UPI003208E95A
MQRIKPGQAVQFTFAVDDFLPGATSAWRALGDGTVDAQGHYTAPAISSGIDAVVCDLEHDGVLFSGAYNTVQVSTLDEESKWNILDRFELSVPANRNTVYGNRYQQQQVDIVVETVPVDGKDYRLTPTEQASLMLVELKSNDDVHALSEASQGIENDWVYATRTTRNAFKLNGQPGFKDSPHDRRLKSPGSTIHATRYLHVNDPNAVSAKFYARFTKDGGGEFTSRDKDPTSGTVQVNVASLPTYQREQYSIERRRVKGKEPNDDGRPGDEYNLEYSSRDYWRFRCLNADFLTAQITNMKADGSIKKKANVSMIRWESEHPNEIMASYTGFIFHDRLEKQEANTQPERVIEFDEDLNKVFSDTTEVWGGEVVHSAFSSGMAVICNDRKDDVAYKPLGEQAHLAQELVIKFVDEYGNVHHVVFSYGAKGLSGNRNVVSWELLRPKA